MSTDFVPDVKHDKAKIRLAGVTVNRMTGNRSLTVYVHFLNYLIKIKHFKLIKFLVWSLKNLYLLHYLYYSGFAIEYALTFTPYYSLWNTQNIHEGCVIKALCHVTIIHCKVV